MTYLYPMWRGPLACRIETRLDACLESSSHPKQASRRISTPQTRSVRATPNMSPKLEMPDKIENSTAVVKSLDGHGYSIYDVEHAAHITSRTVPMPRDGWD